MIEHSEPQPLVSVVIPAYNRPDYLHEALSSVVAQRYRNLEIIVQDNASPIDIESVVRSFGDPRIRFFRNAENIGQFANFVTVFRRATGKYVACLSDDDVWEEEYLSTLVPRLEEDPDLVVGFCDHSIIDGEGRIDEVESDANSRRWQRHILAEGTHKPFDEIALVYRSICSASAAVFRRDAIDWYAIPDEVGLGFDLFLSYLAARTGRGAWYSRRRLVRYRVHGGSMTNAVKALNRRVQGATDAIFYWSTFLNDPRVARHRAYFRMKLTYNTMVLVSCLLRQGKFAAAARQAGALIGLRLLTPAVLVHHLMYAARLRRPAA
jgi:glycosyltransferase involved in cell wall biosynthesis